MIDNLQDALGAFDEMLNDVYSDVTVGEVKVSTSTAMRKLTPFEYELCFTEWLADEGLTVAAEAWSWPGALL
jgi:hypothetical protein